MHKDLALRTGGTLAIAFRKESPTLREFVNEWIRKHGEGDAFRNVLERRYLQVIDLFRKYGDQYSVDYLLMAAQGYQESTLDQSVKSRVGAIGVMQVMPPTGGS